MIHLIMLLILFFSCIAAVAFGLIVSTYLYRLYCRLGGWRRIALRFLYRCIQLINQEA